MTYMIKRSGQEAGPFSIERLREIRETGAIDDSTLFRPYGTPHWLAAVDLEDALAGALPLLPEQVSQKQVEPAPVLGWSNGRWIAAAIALIVGLVAINYAINHKEIARNVAKQRADRAAADAASWAKAERDSELMRLGREHGKLDGINVASHVATGQMTKPSRVQIVALGISRAKDLNISDPAEQAVFLRRYEEVFKDSYKATADW